MLRAYGKDTSAIKLGYSSNINERIRSYYNTNPFTEVIFTCSIKWGLAIEQMLHTACYSKISREWYSEDKLNTFIKYLTHYSDDYIFHKEVNNYENTELIPINLSLLNKELIEKLEDIDSIIDIPEFEEMINMYEILGIDAIKMLVTFIENDKSNY